MTEFDFRFSRRHSTDGARTMRSLEAMGGKRLKLTTLRAEG